MGSGYDWLFRPVLRGMYSATALRDGSIDLAFVLLCNDAVDVENENNRRDAEANK
jgi:hypothetical protein